MELDPPRVKIISQYSELTCRVRSLSANARCLRYWIGRNRKLSNIVERAVFDNLYFNMNDERTGKRTTLNHV